MINIMHYKVYLMLVSLDSIVTPQLISISGHSIQVIQRKLPHPFLFKQFFAYL